MIDPGPQDDAHVDALLAALDGRGELAAIVLTHDHPDHSGAVASLASHTGAPVAAMRDDADIPLGDGLVLGPLTAIATPGHSRDHYAFLAGGVCFTGDAVLGEGSVFVAPDPGALAAYLAGLQRLRSLDLTLIAPGHGPVLSDPRATLDRYIEHRLDRERRLLEALADGLRDPEELLDRVWSEVPAGLRPAARWTLDAHLGKLADEGRLPG